MIVKICGIKRVEDARKAIELGADRIGLLVGKKHYSNDFIDVKKAREIVNGLTDPDPAVLVTHLTDCSEIINLVQEVGVTKVQLHGNSSPDDIKHLRHVLPKVTLIKSLHVIDESSIEEGKTYLDCTDEILLDTLNRATDQAGGTGLPHDWKLSKQVVSSYKIPVILAGGLTPDNVEEAIKIVAPFGVDVNSGVKSLYGFKDLKKLRLFIHRAKGVK